MASPPCAWTMVSIPTGMIKTSVMNSARATMIRIEVSLPYVRTQDHGHPHCTEFLRTVAGRPSHFGRNSYALLTMRRSTGYASITNVIFQAFHERQLNLEPSSDYKSSIVAHEKRTVAVVAPQWLQDGLAVVIKAISNVQLVVCTGSIHTLLLLDLERSPDLVILALDEFGSQGKEPNPADQVCLSPGVLPGSHSGSGPRQCCSG